MSEDNKPLTREQFERAMEALMTNVSEVREELGGQLKDLKRELDLAAGSLVAIRTDLANLNKWASAFERDFNMIRSTQVAQQKAIDGMNERISKLEPPA